MKTFSPLKFQEKASMKIGAFFIASDYGQRSRIMGRTKPMVMPEMTWM
jgi:hypothetical protein